MPHLVALHRNFSTLCLSVSNISTILIKVERVLLSRTVGKFLPLLHEIRFGSPLVGMLGVVILSSHH